MADDFELIMKAGPGTPMGELMRQYWIPAALSGELKPDGTPVRILLLNEKLIGFRDTEGRVGIMDQRCPHRCASLFFGRNEEGGLRCVYHGWKFDVEGNCLDQLNIPERQHFKDRVHTKAYLTKEHNGVVCLTIIIGQLPKLFGFSVDGDGLIAETVEWVRAVANGLTVPAALAIGVLSLILILAFQRWLPRVPGVLVAVVLAILAVSLFDLTDRGVKVVGALPEGFPPFTVPIVPFNDLLLLFAGALGIALVSLTDTISTSSAFAARSGAQVDGNKEMIGIGAANIAAGFFQGFPVSTSGSRTAVAWQNGAKTQVTGLVGAAAILLLLLFAPGLLKNLPQPTLAAVVIAASLSLAEFRHETPVAAAQIGLRAGHGGLSRCCTARRAAGHRSGRRTVDP